MAASHTPRHQLKVLPRDLQLCSETASGVDVGGQHEWGELVQLDPQTVGVIVRLERETFQVSPSCTGTPGGAVSPAWGRGFHTHPCVPHLGPGIPRSSPCRSRVPRPGPGFPHSSPCPLPGAEVSTLVPMPEPCPLSCRDS